MTIYTVSVVGECLIFKTIHNNTLLPAFITILIALFCNLKILLL